MNLAASLPTAPAIGTLVNAPAFEDCTVIELRDYTLHAGQRDSLIELFEREFIESQEALGLRVMAQFRDLDRPGHFVWLRGFADMPARHRGLEAFYGGPVWQRHRGAANAMMLDSDDVRLLRCPRPAWAMVTPAAPRPRGDADTAPSSTVYLLTQWPLRAPAGEPLRQLFERDVLPALRECGAPPCAVWETEPAPNNFPRLPVREGEPVFAWLSRLPHAAAAELVMNRLAASLRWAGAVRPRLQAAAAAPPSVWRLQPTARSLLR